MTRFLIAKQVGPDAYRTIAGLCDGYLEHTGSILLTHYSSPEIVDKLLDLGDIHCLDRKLEPDKSHQLGTHQEGVTKAFARDFGDTDTAAKVLTLNQLNDPTGSNDFIYIFTEANQWVYFKGGMAEHGLLDLRDSVDRLTDVPIHEDVYIYRNTKNQSVSEMLNNRKIIGAYMKSKGYENGGVISTSRPMSEIGSEFQDIVRYCQKQGISRLIVEDIKALGEKTEIAERMLACLCGLGFTVELAASGTVYEGMRYDAPQEEQDEVQGGIQCQM